jgi:hypothetical protein
LEKFLELAIQSHSDRQAAVTGLKASIDSLLSYLSAQNQTRLPMFVFVDELDRCRPDYAVRLLEGVKHLFDAPAVCFIFSTNLKQLAASTQAIYGSNFDATRYLKRFFNFEYLLPSASPVGLAEQLTQQSDIVARRLPVFDGLPQSNAASTDAERVARSFVFVVQALISIHALKSKSLSMRTRRLLRFQTRLEPVTWSFTRSIFFSWLHCCTRVVLRSSMILWELTKQSMPTALAN